MTEKIKLAINDYLMADLIKKRLGQKGPYTDMQLTQDMAAFSTAVDQAHSVHGQATSLKTKTPSGQRNKKTNYFLTDEEKALLQRRAREFSIPGIVPYDVLEEFLYVLCYIDDYETLSYVALATGVVGLDNAEIIRVPMIILNVPDLAKIGYLANGLAALTKQFSSERFPQSTSASSDDSSAYSGINKCASTGQPMTAFSGLTNITSTFSQVLSVMSAVQSLISTFSSDGNVQTKISSITNVASQINSVLTNVTSTLSVGAKNNIAGTFPLLNQVQGLAAKTDLITRQVKTLQDVTSSNSYPKYKVDDINMSLKTYFDSITSIASSLSNISSALSGIVPPNGGNLSQPAQMITSLLTGGATASSFVVGKVLGQEIPQNVLAKNPLSLPVSYMAQTLFGASLVPSLHHRDGKNFPPVPIAIFASAAAGAATAAFKMQNSQSMGGSMSLSSAVTSLLGNVSSSIADMHINNVSSILGAATTAVTELRRSDNAIPMMIALATSFSNDTGNPFATSIYSEGWKIASAAGNMLQKEGKTIVV